MKRNELRAMLLSRAVPYDALLVLTSEISRRHATGFPFGRRAQCICRPSKKAVFFTDFRYAGGGTRGHQGL